MTILKVFLFLFSGCCQFACVRRLRMDLFRRLVLICTSRFLILGRLTSSRFSSCTKDRSTVSRLVTMFVIEEMIYGKKLTQKGDAVATNDNNLYTNDLNRQLDQLRVQRMSRMLEGVMDITLHALIPQSFVAHRIVPIRPLRRLCCNFR